MVKHRSFEQTSNGKRDFPLSRHVQISISAPFCYRMCFVRKESPDFMAIHVMRTALLSKPFLSP